ncbi:energy transducer TonB [Aestuariibaculum sediminum]|uniref:TonB C-terminal domain-containing protein n=1 Tax=Aestuariibaculum sediminum TaxID=2770637 RepID=A0A8J6Q0A9_9FLAO|nr:energy transducer TonB [Aestuariibaculum sediminum]MBD0833018.1 hypothetical protein [Aestuariibaculum sediminum]
MKYLLILAFACSTLIANAQTNHPDGPYKEYYDNGQLKQEGFYKNDKKIKVWKTYYDNGQLLEVNVNDNNGKFTGMKREYSKEGVILKETKNDVEGRLTTYEYDENGTLFCSVEIKEINNKGRFVWSGPYKEYYKNGILKIESHYDNYELNGLWKQFYETGELEWEVRYVNGYKQGEYAQYSKNKKLKVKGIHEFDVKTNTETRFDSLGNVVKTFKFKNGVLKKTTGVGNLKEVEVPDGVFQRVPVYPGCENALANNGKKRCMSENVSAFISEKFNTSFVKGTGLNGVQKIYIIFKIDKKGNVIDIQAKAKHKALEAEAIRVVALLPRIKPGLVRGKPVTVPYALPISLVIRGN